MSLLVRPADKIKLSVIDYLIENYPGIIIGNEVMYGTTKKVVDLIALYRGEIYAIEIKSENDNTRRLSEQLKEYARIFDYTIVFTHPKHTSEVISLSKARISIFEVIGEKFVRRSPLKRNRPIKGEMIHSINTSFLKKYVPSRKTRDTSDNIRAQISRKYQRDTIHRMLYDFLTLKLEERFELYIKERGEKSYDDLSLLSAQLNLGPI
ncbi:hypothetical protein HMPREF1554_02259 [Porphyromonas gingivalis F0569]|uniref:sce7726 family protein n=1 Tax=Porphyromonas gingivalis TaxID=837 RepID=UPI0003AD46B1|nr:sce7726 family protein [Porphyromonas gingivalis]ERJ63772.1 hypothetical protein HMPREF1554_02259 [Porphyromonas gingivalis F0569]